nr:hypothetical protein DWUX_210 [Desulfovibrio diazotrophicus]
MFFQHKRLWKLCTKSNASTITTKHQPYHIILKHLFIALNFSHSQLDFFPFLSWIQHNCSKKAHLSHWTRYALRCSVRK